MGAFYGRTLLSPLEMTMAISMYQISVPVLVRLLTNLSAILGKAAEHAENKFDPRALLDARLSPDMFTLTRQVQVASDMSKAAVARLAGVEIPVFEDKEASIPDLQARLTKTIEFLKTLRPEQIDGSEDRDITVPLRDRALHFKGLPYVLNWVLPNFYFHVTTAYAILRHNGVPLGKMDFLGNE
jgi:uncharacterized protein